MSSIKLLFAASGLGLAALAQGQLPSAQQDFVLSGPTAYGMMPPEAIAGSAVRELMWSDDGKYLVATRIDTGSASQLQKIVDGNGKPGEAAETSLTIYSMSDRKATIVWRAPALSAELVDVQWFTGSDTALAVIEERLRTIDPKDPDPTREVVLFVDARAGLAQPIFSVDQNQGEPGIFVRMSPSKPMGMLGIQTITTDSQSGGDSKRRSVHFQYRVALANGGLKAAYDFNSGISIGGWLQDGLGVIATAFGFDENGKLWRSPKLLDLATGALTNSPTKPARYMEPTAKPQPIKIGPGEGAATTKQKSRTLRPTWLSNDTDDEHALVISDASTVILSPTLTGVAYISQGVAMVRPIVQVPKELFLQALKAEERTALLSRAKQVALGLLMYAGDMDDMLPSNKADIANLIAPYLKDSSLTSGFVYSFQGGLMTDVEKPAETIMGYIGGAGGRAVIYMDGHVKWQSDN